MMNTDQLAVGILYLNLGRAGLEFPTTTRAHPSYQVQVTLLPGGGLLDEGHRSLFPFFVKWDIWQNVVVPLFADRTTLVKVGEEGNITLRQHLLREYVTRGDPAPLIAKIKHLLSVTLIAEGYLSPEAGTSESVAEEAAPGDPVVPPGTNDGSPFVRFN